MFLFLRHIKTVNMREKKAICPRTQSMKEQGVVPFSLCKNTAIRSRESQNKLSVHFQGISCPMTWCVLWTTRDKDTLYIFSFLREFLCRCRTAWTLQLSRVVKKKRFETGVNDTSKGAFLGSPTWVLSFSLRVCCLGIFAASPAGPATLTSGGATVGRMMCAYLSVLLFGWFVTWSALYESVPLFVLCTPSLFSPNLLAFEISVS